MEQIRIDLVPGGVTPNAHASQYDVGRGIRFLLYNGGNSYTLAGTETITVDVTKPDGTTDTVSVTNTSSNYVDFVTTDGLLNQAGLYPCEISIVDGGTEIGSQNFNLRAEADAYDGADIVTVTVGPADICTFETTLAEPLVNVKTALAPSLTGYTAVNLTACGVNLGELTADSYDNSNNISISYEESGIECSATGAYARCMFVLPVKSGQTYTISFKASGTGNYNRIQYNDSNNWGTNYGQTDVTSTLTTYTKTFTATTNVLSVSFYLTSTGTTGTGVISDFQLEVGSTAHEYHPYTGNAYAIALGDTYYGGTLDVTSGEYINECNKKTYVGADSEGWLYSSGWSTANTAVFYCNQLTDAKYTSMDELVVVKCSSPFTPMTRNEVASADTNGFGVSGTIGECYPTVRIDKTLASTVDEFKAWLANNNTSITYYIVTPVTVQLTPTAVRAIVGTNNVYSDTGTTELTYLEEG